MGRTPGKSSPTGQAVQDRMQSEGTLKGEGDNKEVLNSKGQWVPISTTDMSHIKDAVTAWNEGLYKTGGKSPEVRKFMKDSNNYELDSSSINRSNGAKLKQTYRPPESSKQ